MRTRAHCQHTLDLIHIRGLWKRTMFEKETSALSMPPLLLTPRCSSERPTTETKQFLCVLLLLLLLLMTPNLWDAVKLINHSTGLLTSQKLESCPDPQPGHPSPSDPQAMQGPGTQAAWSFPQTSITLHGASTPLPTPPSYLSSSRRCTPKVRQLPSQAWTPAQRLEPPPNTSDEPAVPKRA